MLNAALSTVGVNELAAGISARLSSQTGTGNFINKEGGTTTTLYKVDAKYEGVSSIDQVGPHDHLLVVVNDVLGQADPKLGGGPAGGEANIGSKVAFIEAGSGLENMIDMGFHEIGHDLGLAHPNENDVNNPMSYTGQKANFQSWQLRSIWEDNESKSLNQGQNTMTIGNKREIDNVNSTQYRPYIGTRKPGMKVPMPTEHN